MATRRAAFALALVSVSGATGGCAFDGQIPVRLSGGSPVVVTQSSAPEQIPHRSQGVTARKGQVVGIACSITVVYDVREATGSTVLAQTYVAHLRTRPLPRGTAYAFDCTGPLIVELPADASDLRATSTDAAGLQTALPVQVRVSSVAIAGGKHLRAEPQTQLIVASWPRTLAAGEYRLELAFALPPGQPIREKAVFTASISCGRSTYAEPILPVADRMARVPAFTVRPSATTSAVMLPRVAGAIGEQSAARRTLSCRPQGR